MAQIRLYDMEFYAHHGHFQEEQRVGNYFVINLALETDISKASKTDKLEDALDYVKVYSVIEQEMKQRSYLLESVLMRIVKRLFKEFKQIDYLEIEIAKINPPLGGKTHKVALVWKGTKNEIKD
jgi:dihydroneopterin aldolase